MTLMRCNQLILIFFVRFLNITRNIMIIDLCIHLTMMLVEQRVDLSKHEQYMAYRIFKQKKNLEIKVFILLQCLTKDG